MQPTGAKPALEFRFDKGTHTYWLGTRRIPGVSEILKRSGLAEYPEHAKKHMRGKADIGSDVHLATEYFDSDGVDYTTIAPSIRPYFDAYALFCHETQFHPLEIELRMHCCVAGIGDFGMTLDRVGNTKILDRPLVLDIKCTSTALPSHRVQTAAYRLGYSKRNPGDYERGVVYLRPDGTYKFCQHTDKADEQTFLAALWCVTWKDRNLT
jgi:hypothetical protein